MIPGLFLVPRRGFEPRNTLLKRQVLYLLS